jgi:precorrin-3B C17-methyltransferase
MAGKIFVVGLGPGGKDQLTPRGEAALAASDVLVGYTVYIDLIRDRWPEKELVATPMTTEVDRCLLCLDRALGGQTAAMVCSGDPGIYGMAGLMYQVCRDHPEVEIQVIPGVTAASAGAALLGAPLMHDFAVISLSDALTPWETIEKRLLAAADGDFVLCIYNPASHRRPDTLARAAEILLTRLPPERPCGLARRVGREGESWEICTLRELGKIPADMFTTVFIGNGRTLILNGRMVTPRGYENRGKL